MIKRHRLVALFDILGFSQRLQTDSLAKIQRELRTLIRQSRSKLFTEPATANSRDDDDNLEHVRFAFDSVVLVSLDTNDGYNVHKFILACVTLLELGFKHQFPFRGSISLGDVFVDEETGLLLGDQFPRLRDAELMQDWSGCFVLPAAEEIVFQAIFGIESIETKKQSPEGHDLLVWTDISIKTAFAPRQGWCINWVYLLGPAELTRGLAFMQSAPSKHSNTEQFVRKILSLPHDVQLLNSPPAPLGTFIKTLRSRYGFRVQFVDKDGNSVRMPALKLQFTVVAAKDSEVFERRTIDTRTIKGDAE